MVDFSRYESQRWFKELKQSRKTFFKMDNIIESTKAKYDRSNRVYEWITGAGLTLFVSLSIADVLKNQNLLIIILGAIGYLLSLIGIFGGIIIYWLMNKRQEVALIWLYRQKDEEEKLKNYPKNLRK